MRSRLLGTAPLQLKLFVCLFFHSGGLDLQSQGFESKMRGCVPITSPFSQSVHLFTSLHGFERKLLVHGTLTHTPIQCFYMRGDYYTSAHYRKKERLWGCTQYRSRPGAPYRGRRYPELACWACCSCCLRSCAAGTTSLCSRGLWLSESLRDG